MHGDEKHRGILGRAGQGAKIGAGIGGGLGGLSGLASGAATALGGLDAAELKGRPNLLKFLVAAGMIPAGALFGALQGGAIGGLGGGIYGAVED